MQTRDQALENQPDWDKDSSEEEEKEEKSTEEEKEAGDEEEKEGEESSEEEGASGKKDEDGKEEESLEDLAAEARRNRELFKKHDIDPEKLLPEFTRRSQRISELEKENERLRTGGGGHRDSGEEIDSKPMTRGEFMAMRKVEEDATRLDGRIQSLAEKWDGKDGKPLFDPLEVLEELEQLNPSDLDKVDLEALFIAKHRQEFETFWRNQALAKKPPANNLSKGNRQIDRKTEKKSIKSFDDNLVNSIADSLEASEQQ